MRKKLPTQREKGESNLGTREEENSDEKEMIFLTVHYSEEQYIYIYTQRSAMALSEIPEFTGLIRKMRREFRSLINY